MPPQHFPDYLRNFVDTSHWTFAKTMPKWPHEYLVREKVDDDLFVQLVLYIRVNGYAGRFYKKEIIYYEEKEKIYWTMGAPIEETTIINRCRKEDSFEYREKHGLLQD